MGQNLSQPVLDRLAPGDGLTKATIYRLAQWLLSAFEQHFWILQRCVVYKGRRAGFGSIETSQHFWMNGVKGTRTMAHVKGEIDATNTDAIAVFEDLPLLDAFAVDE